MTDPQKDFSAPLKTAETEEEFLAVETQKETEGKAETEKDNIVPAEKDISQPKPTSVKKPVISRIPKKIPAPHDPLTIKIERVLEEGLEESYQKLSPVAKQEFKIKGEATATAIKELLFSTKVQVKKILNLIIAWLKLLPGVNRFFLEQEAKIKTDKLLAIKKREEEKESQKII